MNTHRKTLKQIAILSYVVKIPMVRDKISVPLDTEQFYIRLRFHLQSVEISLLVYSISSEGGFCVCY